MEAANSTVSSGSIDVLFGDDPQQDSIEVSSRRTTDDSGQRLEDYLASSPRIPQARPLPSPAVASTSGASDPQRVTIAGGARTSIPRGIIRVNRPAYQLPDGEVCD